MHHYHGNGEKKKIWKDRWLNGQAPKDLARDCYRWAWRKNISVAKAMDQRGWMRGLRRMYTERALTQFVHLWTQLQTICLHPSNLTQLNGDLQLVVTSL